MTTNATATMNSTISLVLASGSATRAALLRAAGLDVVVRRPLVDEESAREALAEQKVTARDAATALAELKAAQVARSLPPQALVLAADQILDLDGAWLGKASNRAEASAQLRRLSGRPHRLVSAAVLFRGGERIWHAAETVTLHVRPMSDPWIETYLDTVGAAAVESVGCYQLEGLGSQMMHRVDGSYFAVLGLPLLPLLEVLREQNVLGR